MKWDKIKCQHTNKARYTTLVNNHCIEIGRTYITNRLEALLHIDNNVILINSHLINICPALDISTLLELKNYITTIDLEALIYNVAKQNKII